MNLTTRCPACGTLFKVVPDQLRISEGWVRCGRCNEVFDAQSALSDVLTPSAVGPVSGGMAQMSEPAGPAVAPAPEFTPSDPVGPGPTPAALPPEAPADDLDAELAARLAEIADAIAQNETDPLPDPRVRAADARADPAPSTESVASASELPDALFPPPDSVADGNPQFVQQAQRRAFWRKPLVRANLWVLGLALVVVLVAQVVRQERDRMAAHLPGLTTWLQFLCEPLRCEVKALRLADAVLIDSSTFARTAPKTFRLSVVLRNKGMVKLATPAVEVTLTDTRDQVVIRRVVLPAELAPDDPVIEPGGDLSRSLMLALADDADATRVSGYRVVAFYP